MKTYRLKEDSVLYPKGTEARWVARYGEEIYYLYPPNCIWSVGKIEAWQIEGNEAWEEEKKEEEYTDKDYPYLFTMVGEKGEPKKEAKSWEDVTGEQEKPTRWRAKEREEYWTCNDGFIEVVEYGRDLGDDLNKYAIGNMFPSQKQARLYRLRLQSMLEMGIMNTRGGRFDGDKLDGQLLAIDLPQKYCEAWETDLYDPNLFKDE